MNQHPSTAHTETPYYKWDTTLDKCKTYCANNDFSQMIQSVSSGTMCYGFDFNVDKYEQDIRDDARRCLLLPNAFNHTKLATPAYNTYEIVI